MQARLCVADAAALAARASAAGFRPDGSRASELARTLPGVGSAFPGADPPVVTQTIALGGACDRGTTVTLSASPPR